MLRLVDYRPKFQSTLPLRGATTLTTSKPVFELFQSTLPLRGATGHIGVANENQ